MDYFEERRAEMRSMYGLNNPRSFAKITALPSPTTVADEIAALRENQPDEYACLSEHLPLAEMERDLRS